MAYTPKEHLEVRNRPEARAMGVPWNGEPYGVLLCLDEHGQQITLLTEDITYHRMLVGAGNDLRADIEIPPEVYTWKKPGWPGEPGWKKKS